LSALTPFQPWNAIERRILETRDGRGDADALIRAIAEADLFIPSAGDVQPDGGGYRPILLEQDDLSLVAVFTAAARMEKGMAPTLMRMPGRAFFLRLPKDFGVIVNPGFEAQIIMAPEGVAALKEDLRGPVAGAHEPR
jgi:hypothetical protein